MRDPDTRTETLMIWFQQWIAHIFIYAHLYHTPDIQHLYYEVFIWLQCIPQIYLVGWAKSGTTDLWWFWNNHPQLIHSFYKETQFISQFAFFPVWRPGLFQYNYIIYQYLASNLKQVIWSKVWISMQLYLTVIQGGTGIPAWKIIYFLIALIEESRAEFFWNHIIENLADQKATLECSLA